MIRYAVKSDCSLIDDSLVDIIDVPRVVHVHCGIMPLHARIQKFFRKFLGQGARAFSYLQTTLDLEAGIFLVPFMLAALIAGVIAPSHRYPSDLVAIVLVVSYQLTMGEDR